MIHRIGLPLCHDHPNSSGSIPNTAWDSSCGCIYRQSRPNDSTGSAVQSLCHVLYHTERLHCGHVLRNDGACSRSYVTTHHPPHQHRCTYAEQHGCSHLRRGEEYSICSKFGFTFTEYGFDLPLRKRGPQDFRLVFRRQGCPVSHRMADVRYDHFEVPVGL